MLEFNPKLDYGSRLNAILWLMISVAALFLFTRLYLKNCQNRGLWWDDYALLAAWIFQAAQGGLVSYIVSLGYGKPVVPPENARLLGLPAAILSMFLIFANFLGKLSFALTLLRLPAVWMRVSAWFIIVTLAATLGVSSALIVVGCSGFKRETNCVPVDISIRYNMFSCGTIKCVRPVLRKDADNIANSLLCGHGCPACISALEVHLGVADEQEGEVWRRHRHEHGRLVCPPSPFPTAQPC